MVMVVDAETRTRQRALLTRLLELTGEQRQALEAGDIAALEAISSLRAQLLKSATSFVPPQCQWDTTLQPLAVELQQASNDLQRDLQAAMEQVKRDLRELGKREHLTEYVPSVSPPRRMAWKG